MKNWFKKALGVAKKAIIKDGSTIAVETGKNFNPGQILEVKLQCLVTKDMGTFELMTVSSMEIKIAPGLPPVE